MQSTPLNNTSNHSHHTIDKDDSTQRKVEQQSEHQTQVPYVYRELGEEMDLEEYES